MLVLKSHALVTRLCFILIGPGRKWLLKMTQKRKNSCSLCKQRSVPQLQKDRFSYQCLCTGKRISHTDENSGLFPFWGAHFLTFWALVRKHLFFILSPHVFFSFFFFLPVFEAWKFLFYVQIARVVSAIRWMSWMTHSRKLSPTWWSQYPSCTGGSIGGTYWGRISGSDRAGLSRLGCK